VSASRLHQQSEGRLTSADGTRLYWRGWEVAGASIALAVVPGLGDHSGRYESLAQAMARSGISTFAVDLRGMGRSPGQRGHLRRWHLWEEDLAALVRLAGERSPAAEVVPLGHSFGGLVVVSSLLSGRLACSRFALSNPAFRLALSVPGWKLALGRGASLLLPRLALANGLDPTLLSNRPEVAQAYRDDPLVHDRISSRLFTEWAAAVNRAQAGARALSQPYLLILGAQDALIDGRGALEFAHQSRSADVREYLRRRHEPFNDTGADEVFGDLGTWLLDRGGVSSEPAADRI